MTSGSQPAPGPSTGEEQVNPQNRLAALGAHLAARRLEIELTDRALRVANPNRNGCCDQVRHAADTVTCRPRRDDGGRWWYFTSWNEPIAQADRVIEAAVYILGYLVHDPDIAAKSR